MHHIGIVRLGVEVRRLNEVGPLYSPARVVLANLAHKRGDPTRRPLRSRWENGKPPSNGSDIWGLNWDGFRARRLGACMPSPRVANNAAAPSLSAKPR